MLHQIFLSLALLFLVASGFLALLVFLLPYKRQRIKPFYLLTGGTFLSGVLAFFPLYEGYLGASGGTVFDAVLSSIHNAIRMYVVDCDISFVVDQCEALDPIFAQVYLVLFAVLLLLAPLMTAGIVLSFFGSLSAYARYFLFFFKADAYIFSSLNERSLALAKSLYQNAKRRPAIIFTGVTDRQSEDYEKAKSLRAIFFEKNITSINFRWHSCKSKLYFFVIGEDDTENVDDVISLAAPPLSRKVFLSPEEREERIKNPFGGYDYPRVRFPANWKWLITRKCTQKWKWLARLQRKKGDTRIYLFSINPNSQQHMSVLHPAHLRIRRVNDVQSLVYNLLYNAGMAIFDGAKPTGKAVYNSATGENDPEKKIHALVLGMGLHGAEMVKALAWFGQMHPYRLEIDAFDMADDASLLFQSAYPELFDCNPKGEPLPRNEKDLPLYRNGDFETPGEAHYRITIHDGINAMSAEFDRLAAEMTDATYVFVALGDDERNISASTKLRILFRRMGIAPYIHTIIYNTNAQKMLERGVVVGTKNDTFNIHPLGDVSSAYSEDCVLGSELEKLALERHLQYTYKCIAEDEKKSGPLPPEERADRIAAEEETFWSNDYNYRSSVASAIHFKFKKLCRVTGADKKPAERTMAEREFFCRMEHQRWNAFVRSDGQMVTPLLYNEDGTVVEKDDKNRPDGKTVKIKQRAKRDRLAKTHHLLVPFDDLPYSEQIKDED